MDRQWTNVMEQDNKPLKVYYSIGEVADMFGVCLLYTSDAADEEDV